MKNKHRLISLFIVGFILLILPLIAGNSQLQNSNSCSIFTIALGDTVYFGNNEDFLLDGTYLWLVPRQDYEIGNETLNLPGVMLLGFDHNNHPVDGRFQGGMNEYGLCWDSNGLPAVPMEWNVGGKELWYFNTSIWVWMQPLLECRNTSDVINWYETYDLGDGLGGQSHFCDADGNALVVGVNSTTNLTYTTMGEDNFLVSTNFNLAWPDNHYDPYPCPRYQTVTTMLEEITTEEDLTPEACQDILKEVASTQTSYSNIFDSVNQEMYLNIYQDFENTVKLNLHEELAKVTPYGEETLYHPSYYYKQILLADLFKNDSIPGYRQFILIASMIIGTCSLSLVLFRNKIVKLR